MSYICNACGKDLSKKDVLVTIDKEIYCANAHNCNEYHVNSVKNILERKAAQELYSLDEIDEVLFQRMDFPEETKDSITRIIKKPQSIRIQAVDMALFLTQYIEKYQLSSLSEAVRECIEFAMRNGAMDKEGTTKVIAFEKPEPLKEVEVEPEIKPIGIKLDLRESVTVPPTNDEIETF